MPHRKRRLPPVLRGCLALLLFFACIPGALAYQLPAPTGLRTSFASDDDFLDYVGRKTFNYFWTLQNPDTGLFPDRASNPALCSIAATGFGLSSLNTAVSRGWITRAQGRARVLLTLRTLAALPQGSATTGVAGYRGWFYHFLDTGTGLWAGNSELSTIDTALLMLGVLDCGLFYDDPADPAEAAIRLLADQLFSRLDWDFVLRGDNRVTMSWDPVTGFNGSGWSGHNEALCLYLLGLGAPTNPLPAASWSAWTSTYSWRTFLGQSYAWTPTGSLFTYQYSQCYVDFRGITDPWLRTYAGGIDYFENPRRATLSQQAYALTKPFTNYGALEFGLTACDGPNAIVNGLRYTGYDGRGAPPGPPVTLDDGTLAPSAVLGSLPFAPEVCLPAARHLYDTYRSGLWSDYGFCNSFNVTAGNWFDPDAVGIDSGPALLMIDNYRGGGLWHRMLSSPVIQLGLQRAGFTAPPPEAVTASASANGNQVTVSWNSLSTYETSFQVETSLDGANYSAAVTTVAGAKSATLATQPGRVYLVRVRTNSSAGLSGYRQTVSVTTPAAVVLTAHPSGIVVPVGQPAVLGVTASGTGPFTYQWFKGGAAVPGATADTLTLSSARSSDAGSYTVTVTNSSGSTTSQSAQLTVMPAFFSQPAAVATDATGNAYVADARFSQPRGLAAAADGTLYVADSANSTLRRISPAGAVTTVAGSASLSGHVDGSGSTATFNQPRGLAVDSSGNLYIADTANHTVRKLSTGGAVTTLAGNPGVPGQADGLGSAALFNRPSAVAVDSSGNIYVADTNNNTVRRITPAGSVTTLAGLAGVTGHDDGIGASALFDHPEGLTLDPAGNLLVADTGNSSLRLVSPVGVTATLCGLPTITGLRDGTGASAWFNHPVGLAADPGGRVWVADSGNATLRQYAASGLVTTPILSAAPSGGGSGGGTTPSPTPAPTPSGGGGGAPTPLFLAALAALALLRHGVAFPQE